MIKWGILSTAKIATEQIIPAITESKNSIIRGIASRDIKKAKKILSKKIIGITCHNSINLAKKAIKAKADYLAFGAFNQSKTKKTKIMTSVKILHKVKKFTKTPTVAIGGINAANYKNLLLNNANFLAISGYIWKNKKYKPLQAIERLK